jgi:hypothetical protein
MHFLLSRDLLEFIDGELCNTPQILQQFSAKLDDFLKLSGRNVLVNAGKVSHTEALEKANAE